MKVDVPRGDGLLLSEGHRLLSSFPRQPVSACDLLGRHSTNPERLLVNLAERSAVPLLLIIIPPSNFPLSVTLTSLLSALGSWRARQFLQSASAAPSSAGPASTSAFSFSSICTLHESHSPLPTSLFFPYFVQDFELFNHGDLPKVGGCDANVSEALAVVLLVRLVSESMKSRR